MNPEINLSTDQKAKYEQYFRQMVVILNFTSLLAGASIYTQKGYDDFHVHTVFSISAILTFAYFVYRINKDFGFFGFGFERFRKYSKSWLARCMAILAIVSMTARFFLPLDIVFHVQNALYISAFLALVSGILYLCMNK